MATKNDPFILIFVHWCIISLFIFTFSSLLGFNILPAISTLFWIGTFFFTFRFFKLNYSLLIALIILAISALLILPWFKDLILTPSNDDTINHMGFLDTILNSGNALLGFSLRSGPEFFGYSKFHFYPTGSHALTAIWVYPFVKLFNLSPIKSYQLTFISTLVVWPLVLWEGSKFVFKDIRWELRAFAVAAVFTLPAFPLWPLGEGGISRITAMILLTPLWFESISGKQSFIKGFIWSAIIAPMMLFIHPSIIPFLVLSLLFTGLSRLKGAIIGACFGAALFYFIIHSAEQDVTDPTFVSSILNSIRNAHTSTWYLWFDRIKGPFHYWFGDPYGFGKFFSPKNWFIYYGLILVIIGRLPRVLLLLAITPFALSALSLIPMHIFDQAGMIYYHSVKRIGELTPFIGFIIILFTINNIRKKIPTLIPIFLSISFLIIYAFQTKSGLDVYHQTFASPTYSKFNPIVSTIKANINNERIIVDRHEFDVLRYMIPNKVYTLKPECMEIDNSSNYCSTRYSWRNQTDVVSKLKNSWWLPPMEVDANETAKAILNGQKVIELTSNCHLIHL